MLLKDHFYKLISMDKTDESIHARIQLNSGHDVFKGHFPGVPVTPGVLQLEIIKELLQTAYEQPITMKSMSTCKFLAILDPNEVDLLDMQLKIASPEPGIIRVAAHLRDEQQIYLKVNADYSL